MIVSLLAFVFCHMLTFVHYNGVYHTLGLLNQVHYNEDFIILRFIISSFFPTHFTVTLAELKSIIRYAEDFVVQRLVKSRFLCVLFEESSLPPFTYKRSS